MGETEIGDVRHQLVGHLAIGQITEPLVDIAAPGAEMHLVNRDRRLAIVVARAAGHPTVVLP